MGSGAVVMVNEARTLTGTRWAPHTVRWRASHTSSGDETISRMLFYDINVGITAEIWAANHSASQSSEDEFALSSQQKAVAAAAVSTEENVPVTTGGHAPRGVGSDERPQPNMTLDKLARLQLALTPDRTLTARYASDINDGAAVLLAGSDIAAAEGLRSLATLEAVTTATMAVAPFLPRAA